MAEINETLSNTRKLIQQGRTQEAIDEIVGFADIEIFWLLENIAYDMVSLISGLTKEVDVDARELRHNRELSQQASILAGRLSLSNTATFSTVLETSIQFERAIRLYSQTAKLGKEEGVTISSNTIRVILGVLQYLREHADFSIVFPDVTELNTSTLQSVVIPFISAIEEISILSQDTDKQEESTVRILEISSHSPVELILQSFGVLGPIVLAILYLSPSGQEYIRLRLEGLRANNTLTQAQARKTLAEAEKIEAETRSIQTDVKGLELARTYVSLTDQSQAQADPERMVRAFNRLTQHDFTIRTKEPEKPPKPDTLPEI